jgi:hypothetical protein
MHTKHKKNITTKMSSGGKGISISQDILGRFKEKSNIKFEQQSVKTFRETQGV